MTSDGVETVIALRESGRLDEARDLALRLHTELPDDAQVNLQCAWIHDRLGLEGEAVHYYEKAIASGLEPEDLRHALLGLGSTHRALGHYELALSTLSRGVERFPQDRGLQVFHAIALYNNQRSKEACEALLGILLDATADEEITRYEPALREYAADLDRTWT
jgi:tetratricopeptide (TPR) repeat protein